MTRSKGGSSNASRKPTTGPPKYVRRRERERRGEGRQIRWWGKEVRGEVGGQEKKYCSSLTIVGIWWIWSGAIHIRHTALPFLVILVLSSFFVWLLLYICRKLAKLMNGTISLESEARKGSTFTVQLYCKRVSDSSLSSLIPPEPLSPQPTNNLELPIPPAEAGEQEEAKGDGEKAKKPPKPQRILVSEDNLMNQTLLARVLPLKGIHPYFFFPTIFHEY